MPFLSTLCACENVHISRTPPQSWNKVEPTLALKPRGDVTRSPKRVSVAPKMDMCPHNFFFLKKKEEEENVDYRAPQCFNTITRVT